MALARAAANKAKQEKEADDSLLSQIKINVLRAGDVDRV